MKMKFAALVGIAIFLFFGSATYGEEKGWILEEELVTTAPAGQPSMNGDVKTWMKKDKLKKENFGREAIIYRADKGVAWMMHLPSKTYAEVPLEQIRSVTEQTLKMFAPTPEKTLGDKPLYTRTGKTAKIGIWNSYEMELQANPALGLGMTSRTTLWLSKDLKVGSDLMVKIFAISLGNKISPDMQKLFDVISKLEGYPVKQETVTQGNGQTVSTTLTLKKAEQAAVDDAIFEIPQGFTKTTIPGM